MVLQLNTEVLINFFDKKFLCAPGHQIHGLNSNENLRNLCDSLTVTLDKKMDVKNSVTIRDNSPNQYRGPHKFY